MRFVSICVFILAEAATTAEQTPTRAWPLWDGIESVADYAKRVNLPATQTLDLGGGVKMELVLIPAGKFIMGTPEPPPVDKAGFNNKIVTGLTLLAVSAVALLLMITVILTEAVRQKRRPQVSLKLLLLMTVAAGGCVSSGLHWQRSVHALRIAKLEYAAAVMLYDDAAPQEKPGHPVTLMKPFYMGKYYVTQEQYQEIVGSNPSQYRGKDHPVETVSWNDAQEFCQKMAEITKHVVRLPTEAEWEYSCRAGTTTAYYSGDTEADLSRVAWYESNSNHTTHPVGQKEANAFGLYDMHGNVWQWCLDWHGEDTYLTSPPEDPQGPEVGTFRIFRGGTFDDTPFSCRSAYRYWYYPQGRNLMGFRVIVPAVLTR
jgi:formylglycine-generating enzyme required for sulfatase activity